MNWIVSCRLYSLGAKGWSAVSADITVHTASLGAFALEFSLVCMRHHSNTAAQNTMDFN